MPRTSRLIFTAASVTLMVAGCSGSTMSPSEGMAESSASGSVQTSTSEPVPSGSSSSSGSPTPSPSHSATPLTGQELADLLPDVATVRDVVGSARLAESQLIALEGPVGWPSITAVRPKACRLLAEGPLFSPSEDEGGDAVGFVNAVWIDKSATSVMDALLSGRPIYQGSVTQYDSLESAAAYMDNVITAAPECLQFNVVKDGSESPQEYLEVDVDEDARSVGMYGNFGLFRLTQVGPFVVGVFANRGLEESMLEVETLNKLSDTVTANVDSSTG